MDSACTQLKFIGQRLDDEGSVIVAGAEEKWRESVRDTRQCT